MVESPYNLIPLNCGHCSIGKNHLLGDPYSDGDRVGFTLYELDLRKHDYVILNLAGQLSARHR